MLDDVLVHLLLVRAPTPIAAAMDCNVLVRIEMEARTRTQSSHMRLVAREPTRLRRVANSAALAGMTEPERRRMLNLRAHEAFRT
jgi:hypothetical protein